jgi:AraC family transcriptional regulator
MTRSQSNPLPQESRRCETIDNFVLSEIVYPPSFRIPWHAHELAAFAFTYSGSTSEVFSRTRVDRTERGVLVRPAGEKHSDTVGDQGAKCFLIELSGNWVGSLPRFGSVMQQPKFHPSGVITSLLQRAYREWLQSDTASRIAVQALALETAAHLIRDSEKPRGAEPPLWLRQVKQRLDDTFADNPSLAELAKQGGVHPAHLARHFRRYYGASIGEYLRKRRVEAAMQMLANPDVSLTEIALAAGFAHHAHFTTAFKRFTGLTPSEFRRLRRQSSSLISRSDTRLLEDPLSVE